MGLYVRQMKLGPMDNFVYLIGAEGARETAIVDPAWDVDAALRAAEEDGREVTHALVSHHHFDHVNGLPDLRGELKTVTGGDAVEVGPLRLRALHTPGHTPGSTCWHVEGEGGGIFSGDTVFVNACGRCDLRGGDPDEMYRSISQVLMKLPPSTQLFPGHDYGDVKVSTLLREREQNPYFQFHALDEFIRYRMRPRR